MMKRLVCFLLTLLLLTVTASADIPSHCPMTASVAPCGTDTFCVQGPEPDHDDAGKLISLCICRPPTAMVTGISNLGLILNA